MRPSSAHAVDFAGVSDSEYEHINYPLHSDAGTSLPLYHSSMADEKARRRVRGSALQDDITNGKEQYDYGDESKDVYNKPNRSPRTHIGGGRMPQPPPPPPTSIVRLFFHDFL